ncbi:MAG TPA: hypothetical protein VLK65_21615 [Vicinamibacteria bacterium]|nr:hypothetical protein [Vicinamibacteria bacterium]
MSLLQADEIFACLDRHEVRYVLIGGLAAVLHGSPLPTLDVDICPSNESSNLTRLATALQELEARIRTPDSPDGVKFPYDAGFLANVRLLNLVTRFGDLDLSFEPAGTQGFSDLADGAVEMKIRGVGVPVAALEDVIRSKEAANRPKDQRTLPVLRQLLEEIQKRRDRELE